MTNLTLSKGFLERGIEKGRGTIDPIRALRV